MSRRARIWIGIPCYQGMPPAFMMRLLQLVTAEKRMFDFQLQFVVGDPYVMSARNRVTAGFLGSQCDRLLSLDSDILFTVGDIQRLINDDEPIVGGLFPKKQVRLQWVSERLNEEEERTKKGLLRLRKIGAGFLMIKREVFERMIESGVAPRYTRDETEDVEYDFWTGRVEDDRLLLEDWWFCEAARKLGYDILCDTNVLLQHVGSAIYPIQQPKGG